MYTANASAAAISGQSRALLMAHYSWLSGCPAFSRLVQCEQAANSGGWHTFSDWD